MAEKITLYEANVKMDQALKDTEELRKKTADLKKEADSYRGTEKENTAEHIKAQAAYRASSAELKSMENLTTKLSAANNVNTGTITKLTAANAKLKEEQKGLDLTTKAGLSRNKEINKEIEKNTAFISKNKDSYSGLKDTIGDYQNKLGTLPGPMGGVVQGFMGMAKAAWAFIATPIGAVIAAIVLVVTAIVNVFKKFQPLLDWFEQKIAAVSAVINVVKDAFLGFLSGSKSLSESFKGLGGSMADAAKRAIELKKAQQELEDQQNILIESEAKSKRQIDELLLQSKNRTLSEKERIELIDKALKIEEEAFNKKKKMTDDEYDQAVEKIAIDNRLTEEEKNNLKEQGAAYLLKLQETKGIDDEEVKSFAALSAKREEILDESISIREKAMNRQDVLIQKQEEKEQKRLEEKKKKDEEEQKRKEEQDKKIAEEHQKFLDAEASAEKTIEEVKEAQRREARDKERDARKKERDRKIEEDAINAQNEYDLAQLRGQMLFDLDRENLALKQEQEIAAAEKVGADVNLINEKYALLNKKITQEEIKFKLGLASQFAGNLATIFGKNTKVGKLAASAQTAIDTYAGAISAYKSLAGIPYVGPVLGATAAAAVGVAGAKAIKDIWAVKSGLPGDSGGSSSTPTTGGASVNPSIGNGIVSRSVEQTGNQVNITTQPTLVVDDVTEAQQRKDRINKTQAI